LVNIKGQEVTFMYNQAFMDSNYGFLAYGVSLKEKGSLGFSLTYAGIKDIKETNSLYPTGTGNIFSAQDLAISLSYAKKITSHLSFGNNLKLIRGNIEKESALGFALDTGFLAKDILNDNLSLGFAVLNLGSKMTYLNQKDKLPLTIKLGTSFKLLNDKLLLAIDISKPIDNDLNIKSGFEYCLFNNFSLRGGYSTASQDIGSQFTFGFGLKCSLINLDLSYVPYGDLGNMIRISISYSQNPLFKFGQVREDEDDQEGQDKNNFK